jgi:hypothetical protein
MLRASSVQLQEALHYEFLVCVVCTCSCWLIASCGSTGQQNIKWSYGFTPYNVVGFFCKVLMKRAGFVLRVTVFGVGWILNVSGTSRRTKYSAPCKNQEDISWSNTIYKTILNVSFFCILRWSITDAKHNIWDWDPPVFSAVWSCFFKIIFWIIHTCPTSSSSAA